MEFERFFSVTTFVSDVLLFSITAFFLLQGLTRGEEGDPRDLFVGVCSLLLVEVLFSSSSGVSFGFAVSCK